ncbi:MAG: HEPN domain-containing protein [Pedosphaera sp.]|nr:HEPN domain-containing protein [Pedosphaera sp.]
MPPDLAEWITKAEADWATAQREFRVRRRANFDAVCFHAQQCVEKYLKARLIRADINFPKTHDLVAFLALVQKVEPLWQPWKDHLAKLTHYAVTVRYPGESAERADAAEALKLARLPRAEMRWSLGLTTRPPQRRK